MSLASWAGDMKWLTSMRKRIVAWAMTPWLELGPAGPSPGREPDAGPGENPGLLESMLQYYFF